MSDWGGSMWQYCGSLPALFILSSEYTCTYDYTSLIHIFEAFFFFFEEQDSKNINAVITVKKKSSTPDFI